MAAERRFAALTQIRRQAEGEGDTPQGITAPVPVTSPLPVPHVSPRPAGRPPGKRSDPGWKPKTILMRTATHRRVSAVLLEQDDGPDLSELVDELLTKWLEQR